MDSCKNCAFFNRSTKECRNGAPRLVVVETRDGPVRLTEWPRVDPQLWCGQHRTMTSNDPLWSPELQHAPTCG